jgi:Leucine-rich repeat (LRR) protein
MARDKAYQAAERKIQNVREANITELDLSTDYTKDEDPLTELPASLAELTHLESLSLANNKLKIFPQWLGHLTQLRSLNLSANLLADLPEFLKKLSGLEFLELTGNNLATLPEWASQLSHLRRLDLSKNRLRVLPEPLGRLADLRSLAVSNCDLAVLPSWVGKLTQLQSLELSGNQLTTLPDTLQNLSRLQRLSIFGNRFSGLPDWFDRLSEIQELNIGKNPLTTVPAIIGRLTRLQELIVYESPIADIPDWLRNLSNLRKLYLNSNKIEALPEWLEELRELDTLQVCENKLVDLPLSLAKLENLQHLKIVGNPLNPELSAANDEGLDAIRRYLRLKLGAQVALNEAKLILVGEGEVGKSCLLGALREDPWIEGSPTTHGIQIKPVIVKSGRRGTVITLNGWDFGGQRVYRPTHQLFFSAPAVYLVVWKPREGPQQGFVKEWISLVKHRAPDAKIIVVATHGGKRQRQPDIDRQEIWDLFGKEMVVGFYSVDSKPDKNGKRQGIADLKKAIARLAADLPEMGRKVPQRWQETRQVLKKTGAAYLPFNQVEKLCIDHKMDEEEARDFIRISHRLGHLVHYEHDPVLQDIVALKPDWLSTAISFVLDDEQTRKAHGLVSFERLGQLWNDPKRLKDRYPAKFHPIFLRLMERYDLSYRVADAQKGQTDETSLIAQLVPDVRPPEQEFSVGWHIAPSRGDDQQAQICRIVDAKSGQSATAEGLFYQLIVRLHKYSLGRVNRDLSIHWQRGLVLDDDYNGRALLENVGNDVRITVRAAYPERFLSVLTHEVKWLVENFWKGLRCEVTVPCTAPCGMGTPGTGLFEVEKLITFKRQGMQLFPCYVSGCNQAQDIDGLL